MSTNCHLRHEGEPTERRSVAFWDSGVKSGIYATFEALAESDQDHLVASFDLWALEEVRNKRFHGYDGKFKGCFVFKKDYHRFYGYCFRSGGNLNHTVCVLIEYAEKKSDKTDKRILKRILERSSDESIRSAVAKYLEM